MIRFIIDTCILFLVLFLVWNVIETQNRLSTLEIDFAPALQDWVQRKNIVNDELQSIANQLEAPRAYVGYFYSSSCPFCKIDLFYFDLGFIWSENPSERILSQRQRLPLDTLPNIDTIIRNKCTAGVLGVEGGDLQFQDLPERTFLHCPVINPKGEVVGFFGVSYDQVLSDQETLQKLDLLDVNTSEIRKLLFKGL